MATKAALLPDFPQAFGRKLSKALLLTSVGTVLTASPGWAVVVAPTSITVAVPGTAGGIDESNNTQADGSTFTYSRTGTATSLTSTQTGASTAFVDDVLLRSITFAGVTFQRNSTYNIVEAVRVRVTSGRANINAEFGDQDLANNGGSDGNPNPFVSAGVATTGTNLSGETNAIRESQDPYIQDRALSAAFNSLSISQGTDGEAAHAYRLTFDQGIVDNNNATDNVPELIFFERGSNSAFSLRAITGGTFDAPTFAPTTVSVAGNTATETPSGVFIDTSETPTAQQLGVVGIDLNEFGLTAGQAIYGFDLTTDNTGADIYGNFATGTTSQFRTTPAALVPEPLTILGSGMALGFGVLMKREYSRKRKKTEQTG